MGSVVRRRNYLHRMRVVVMGTGYVGLVTGADLATRGHMVACVDVVAARIDGLQRGVLPFFEPGLEELVARAESRLSFTTDGEAAMRDADVVLCAVGTPLGEDGHADLRAVFGVARMFAAHAPAHAVLVTKSTVPVGTAEACMTIVGRDAVVSNPEFLSQGTAVYDTAHPSRIVIGTERDAARAALRELYASFIADGVPYLEMAAKSAEAVKVASNAFLATKISFINEIANYCAAVGGDVADVATAVGLDPRIGSQFLRAGLGYGGGCLSKDVRSLIAAGEDAGAPFRVLPAVEAVNDAQKFVLYDMCVRTLGNVRGKRVAVWGLSFKPGTDDVRSAPSLGIVERLVKDGAEVVVYDPAAMARFRALFPSVRAADTALAATRDADALFVLTEWSEFATASLEELAAMMRAPNIFDGRGVFAAQDRPPNIGYFGIGCG